MDLKFQNGKWIRAEVARTPNEQRVGMLKYSSLGDNQAMLFPYEQPTDVTFHTVGMKFGIDIIMLTRAVPKKKVANVCR